MAIFERTDDGTVLAGPWCKGFLAALKLRRDAWRPLLDLGQIQHGLLLPILLHCTDDNGRPVLGPTRPGPEGDAFLRNAYHDIPVDNWIGPHLVRRGWGASFGKPAYPGLFRKGVKIWGDQRVHPSLVLSGRKGPALKYRLQHYVDRNKTQAGW